MQIPRLFSLWLLLLAGNASAELVPLPKLELGVSLFALSAPHYRGAAHSTNYLLPIPHFKYRGDWLRIDEGVEAYLFNSENLVLALSGNGSLPVDDATPERVGMEALNASIELGPSLEYRFYQSQRTSLWLELPLRFAITVEGSPRDIGHVFHPRLVWRLPARLINQWKLRFSVGPMYANQRYHDYYYSVSAADELLSRPEFAADAGYSGLRADFSYSKRFEDIWIGGFLRYDSLAGAVFEDSPLVSQRSMAMAGIAVGWIFSEKY